MQQYVCRRLLLIVPVVLTVLLLVFLIASALPGDVVESRLAQSGLSRAEIQKYKHDVGLDRPLYRQFLSWFGNVLHGDLGKSLFTGRAVTRELAVRAPATLELGFISLVVAVLLALPLGVVSAVRPNSPLDYGARLISILGLAIPNFFLAVIAILALSRWFGYFPPIGYTSPFDNPAKNVQQIWLPVSVIGFGQSAAIARMTRSTLIEILRSDYIRTAWAKGLKERSIVLRHALKNALIPVITILGLQVGAVIGGVIVIETLFTIPGMGQMLVEAVFRRDLIPLQSIVLVFAIVVVLVNLAVDLSYVWLDPRIKYR